MRIAYKAFDTDLSCTSGGNRFQYQLKVWNKEPAADCAATGFHCAENPLDCLSYYHDWNSAVYYIVLAAGDMDEDAYDSKIACTKLKLVKQLTMPEFVAHALKYLYDHPQRKVNSRIQCEVGEARGGFAVVRGKNPRAKGELGDILGMAKEKQYSREIDEMGVYVVDGIHIQPGVLYNVNGLTEERE